MAVSDDVRLVCSYAGFESFPRKAVVGWDGEAPLLVHLVFYKLRRVPLPAGLLPAPWAA